MDESTPIVMLRRMRKAAGLSQGELAERVGVSRQSLSAIEAGRQIPSTTLALHLARALRCRVEDLFRLGGGSVVKVRLARPWQGERRVVVGRVDGVLVAHGCVDAGRAADGVVIESVEGSDEALVELWIDPSMVEANLLVAGCAPLLGLLAQRLGQRYREMRASWLMADSSQAMELLGAGLVHIAGMHLANEEDERAHEAAFRVAFPGGEAAMVNLVGWRQGLVVAQGNPFALRKGEDLKEPRLRRVYRAAGSGAQRVFERALKAEEGFRPGEDDIFAVNHREVARFVSRGVADVGVAIEAVAIAEGLDFIALSSERFDLLIPQQRLEAGVVKRFVDLIDAGAFRAEAAQIPGYDLGRTGQMSRVVAVGG